MLIEGAPSTRPPPKSRDFRRHSRILAGARNGGLSFAGVCAGEMHRRAVGGGYPGRNRRMPTCCGVMWGMTRDGDKIPSGPPKRNGASLHTLQAELSIVICSGADVPDSARHGGSGRPPDDMHIIRRRRGREVPAHKTRHHPGRKEPPVGHYDPDPYPVRLAYVD